MGTYKEIKRWFGRVIIDPFLYTNGLYKIYGIMGHKYLYGIVVYAPNSVYRKWQYLRSVKYHTPKHTNQQWYLLKN